MNGIRLTSMQHAHLQRQLEYSEDVRVYRRTLAILEHDAGIPIVRIAENMNVDRGSVHRWIAAFRESLSPCSLLEKPRNGRPRLWTDAHSQWMQALLETSPEELGYFAVNWTVPLLREHLRESIGQNVSDDTIRRGLAALGYVWKRPRYVLAADPDRDKKKTNSTSNQGFAASQRHSGRRRNRSVAVSTVAFCMGQARQNDESSPVWLERPPGDLRNDQYSNRKPIVPSSLQS